MSLVFVLFLFVASDTVTTDASCHLFSFCLVVASDAVTEDSQFVASGTVAGG